MSPFPDDKDDFDDEENKEDVVSQHARMLSVEIANRIHPSLDFFEEHLEEVKEYALVTIAQLEEVKLFLKRQNVKREKSVTSTKKKKKKSKEQEHEQQESFGVSDDENENENENDETSDDDENVLQSRDTRRNRMEIDLSKLTARLEQDFAFIDSARETLNVIERKVSEMEEDVWEKEKATVKTRVDQRVEQVKDQFGRMFSSMFSSSKE
jgi:ABC-type Zn2+ transport system substrate-binding protein/surface adhesin